MPAFQVWGAGIFCQLISLLLLKSLLCANKEPLMSHKRAHLMPLKRLFNNSMEINILQSQIFYPSPNDKTCAENNLIYYNNV
jgi:hypothetical protein